MNICGHTWTDEANPCPYGSTTEHECYNMPGCLGKHMCACELESTMTGFEEIREAYWAAQRRFREASIAMIQTMIPEGVSAVLLDFNDSTPSRLYVADYLTDEGERISHDEWELDHEEPAHDPGEGLFDTLDQTAADMEFADWDEAKSWLMRTEDHSTFIIKRAEVTP